MGWAAVVCGADQLERGLMPSVDRALERACGTASIAENNDHDTLVNNARKWNRAGYLLGYTEGNPESKPLPWEKK